MAALRLGRFDPPPEAGWDAPDPDLDPALTSLPQPPPPAATAPPDLAPADVSPEPVAPPPPRPPRQAQSWMG